MRLHRLKQLCATVLTVAVAHVSPAADDLTPLSEEFDSASAHLNFQRLHQTEGWPANQLQSFFVQTGEGRLVMIPHASSWFQDYKGPLAYKNVTGDFVATVQVQVRNGAENGPSNGPFSFGGLLVRAPKPGVTSPANWLAGQEAWIVQAAGTAGSSGVANYEFKSTDNSITQPNFPAGTDHAVFQIARVGNVFALLRQPVGGSWSVVQRYHRTDMPATMQVGLTAYGNFTVASAVTPIVHNRSVLSGSADLVARFEYYRLQRPVIPQNLQAADFMNPAQVSDAQLLAMFADNANPVPPALTAPVITLQPQSQMITAGDNVTFNVTATGNPAPSYQWQRNGVDISGATSPAYTLNSASTNDNGSIFRVVATNSEGSVTSANATLTVNAPDDDDLSPLSDEFESPSTLPNWQRVYQVEGWGFDQLEQWDINQSNSGRMTMMPHTSSWFEEWRGVQAYKQVTGDFVVTTDVEPTGRSGTGPPNTQYSLAGIMVRAPRPEML
ncbi:MAG: immunoglobulin domain-containing protein, partial [Limisphaerales bacterium]